MTRLARVREDADGRPVVTSREDRQNALEGFAIVFPLFISRQPVPRIEQKDIEPR